MRLQRPCVRAIRRHHVLMQRTDPNRPMRDAPAIEDSPAEPSVLEASVAI